MKQCLSTRWEEHLSLLFATCHNLACIQNYSWKDDANGGYHIVDLDESTVDVSFWKRGERQEFLNLWRQCRQYKRQLKEQKAEIQLRLHKRRLQQSNSQIEYYAGYQSNDLALLRLPFPALKASFRQRKRRVLASRHNGLIHPRELPNKNNRPRQQSNSIAGRPPTLISRKGFPHQTSPMHILKTPQAHRSPQCRFLLKTVGVRCQFLDKDRHNSIETGSEYDIGRNNTCRFDAVLSFVYLLFLSWAKSPVIVSSLYRNSQWYSMGCKARC